MFTKTNIILLLLAIIANTLNGHDIDSLNFVYGCPTMSGKCTCDMDFVSGDYLVKVECNLVDGDPNDFKNELQVLRGYAIDQLIISNTFLNHLPDSPFVESDGKTPITLIKEVKIVDSIINGFGSPNSISNSFFDGLGYSMVTFTVDNCPYMRTSWEWQRFANSLMSAADPHDQPIKSTTLLPDIETSTNAKEIETETTFESTDSSASESSSEFTDYSTNQFTDIQTDLSNSSEYATNKVLKEVWPTRPTLGPIPPIMEPSK